MIPEPQMPTYEDLLWPTLKALESIGGSASIQELSSQLAIDMSLPDEILDVPHKDGPQTKVDYRAAWARTESTRPGRRETTRPQNPLHEEHEAVVRWYGRRFEPDDIDERRVRMSFEMAAARRRGPLMSHRSGSRGRRT